MTTKFTTNIIYKALPTAWSIKCKTLCQKKIMWLTVYSRQIQHTEALLFRVYKPMFWSGSNSSVKCQSPTTIRAHRSGDCSAHTWLMRGWHQPTSCWITAWNLRMSHSSNKAMKILSSRIHRYGYQLFSSKGSQTNTAGLLNI